MNRLLMHAGAALCALAALAVVIHAIHPTLLEAVALGVALTVIGWGLCVGRYNRAALLPAALAAAGILMIGFAHPAAAATKIPLLHAIEAPVLAPPAAVAPTPVNVTVTAPAADTSVAIPLGQWLSLIQGTLGTVLMGLLGMALTTLPAPLAWAIRAYGEDKIVQQAISLAINAVPGAAKGEPLTVEVANPVLAHGLQWVTDNVPKFAIKLMGGEDAIKAKLFAALHLTPDASAAALGVKATA